MDAKYLTSALKADQLPPFDKPEIALIGRSNTGKSTLLNTLLGRKSLARHGRTPGQTQLVNFFSYGNNLIFADLPGYGFSIAARRVASHWESLMQAYIKRPNIKEFLFLVDCRRTLDDDDLDLMYFLSQNLSITVIQTKIDKVNKTALQKSTQIVAKTLKENEIDFKAIVPISSLKKQGIKPLKDMVNSYALSPNQESSEEG